MKWRCLKADVFANAFKQGWQRKLRASAFRAQKLFQQAPQRFSSLFAIPFAVEALSASTSANFFIIRYSLRCRSSFGEHYSEFLHYSLFPSL
jgi:hypothetical protein